MRIIDADNLKDLFFITDSTDIDEVIDSAPTLDATLTIHSWWIPHEFDLAYVTCANCGEGHSNGNFCEMCGAHMDIDNPADVE